MPYFFTKAILQGSIGSTVRCTFNPGVSKVLWESLVYWWTISSSWAVCTFFFSLSFLSNWKVFSLSEQENAMYKCYRRVIFIFLCIL